MRSANVRLALLIIASIMTVVLLSGVVAAVVTDKSPYEWFKKDDVIIDEPIVEEVLPLVASNEEEMNALLVEENIGRSVKYTGETVKNVTLPFEKGDFIGCFCFDISLNLDDFILGLDWENPHYVLDDLDFISSQIYLGISGNCSIEQYVAKMNGEVSSDENMRGQAFLAVFEQRLRSTNEVCGYCLVLGNMPVYWVLNPEFDYDQIDSVPVPGWCDMFLERPNYECEIDFSDMHPAYLAGDCLFFGVADGLNETYDFGSVEIVYENNVEYQIVANENGDGCHFEMID